MKNAFRKTLLLLAWFCSLHAGAQELRREVFSLLDLSRPELEGVRSLHREGKDAEAAKALLEYYRARTGVNNPDLDLRRIRISQTEQQWADDALEHTFFVHKGYQPSFNYGKDIDWEYWPVKDNELRWQLHRHKWFTPMGKAYRVSGDEKYAREWVYQYMDWIKKNPLTETEALRPAGVSVGEVDTNAGNVFFAWRQLEVSNRLQDQICQFQLFLCSPAFTPEFLTEFLLNYHRHAAYLSRHFSEQGNHLLFEAQRIIYAGVFFPEFKEAGQWRKSGIDILNREIGIQVYPDGGQFELDPHYHLAAINIFCKALRMADANGVRGEFPPSYLNTIERMILFYANICFPDYSNPCFSDAKLGEREAEIKNYKDWSLLFPENRQIRWFATEGREGNAPENLSRGFMQSGFFTFRNGWDTGSTVMVVKAGPKAFWHCQPDNGTFELWFNGKNLFPDSGAYVYAGDSAVTQQRNWFRQTRVHNTLTLDNRTLEATDSKTKLWKPEGNVQALVTENDGYKGLRHRRSVFFVDQTYFVIVDEAEGSAQGKINLHYQLCEGKVQTDSKKLAFATDYAGNSNVYLQCFAPEGTEMTKEEGWRSTAYRQKTERTAVAFNTDKKGNGSVRYITVVYPLKDAGKAPRIQARFTAPAAPDTLAVEVEVDGKKQILSY